MNKKIIPNLFLIAVIFFLPSCSSETKNNDNDNLHDEENSWCVNWIDFYETGVDNQICPYQKHADFLKREFSSASATEEGFNLKIDEIMFLEDRGEVIPRGECGQVNKCGITFKNYDRTLFKDSLIDKEIILYWKEGFYGDVYGEYVPRDVQVVRHKDGTLIGVSGIGIVNEDSEHEWDDKVWPSELVPEVKVEQKILPSCESFCVKFQSSADGEPLGDWQYDDLVAPPLEITVTGKKPVVVRNGEVIRSEGYEYFARDSVRATENDSDGSYFIYGKKYKFDFFIVNTEALK